jgi:hypothetical protein
VPVEILDVDLRSLARAVTSIVRRQAAAQLIRVAGLPYVQINGRGINVTVPQGDWEKVLPLIQDDSLSTQVLPVESAARDVDSVVRLSSSTVDARDPLYNRVYGALSQLFRNKVPT